MREELLKGLSKEQLEKASKCKNEKELFALAKEEGVELTEEQLNAVSGGMCDYGPNTKDATCPSCNALVRGEFTETTPGDGKYHFVCLSCGHEWFGK